MPSDTPKPCDHCGAPRLLDFRFCSVCVARIRREMEQSGYLTKIPKFFPHRDSDARENIMEAHWGIDD